MTEETLKPNEITPEIIEEKSEELKDLLTSIGLESEAVDEILKSLKTEGLDNTFTLINTIFKQLFETKAEREQHREALKENIKKLLAGESIEVGEIMKPTTVEKSQVEPSAVATEKEKKEVPEEKKRKIEIKKGSLTEQFNELYEKFQSYKEQFDEYQKAGLIKPKSELDRNIKKLEKILHDTRASKITPALLTQAQGLFEMVEIEFIRQQKQLELKKEREQKITTLHSKIDEFNKQFAEFKKYLADDIQVLETKAGELNQNFKGLDQAENFEEQIKIIDQQINEIIDKLNQLKPKLDEKKIAEKRGELARGDRLKKIEGKEIELLNFQKMLEAAVHNYPEKDPRKEEILQLVNGVAVFYETLKQQKQTELESIDPERIAEFLKAKQEKFTALQEAEKFLTEQAQSKRSVHNFLGKLAYNGLGTIFAFKAPVDWLLYGLRKTGVKSAARGDAYQFMRRRGLEKDVDAFREGFLTAHQEVADSKAWQKKRYEEISQWRKRLAEKDFPPADRPLVEKYIERNETELRLYGRIRELDAKLKQDLKPEKKQGLEEERALAEKELTEILAKSNEFLPVDKQEKIPQKRGLTEESYKALKQEVDNLRQRLESSDLPSSVKKQLQKELNKVINANSQAQEKIESSYFEKKNLLFDNYLGQKVHGSQITRDLLNTGIFIAGGPVMRGLAMLFTSPKMVWDSVSYSLKVRGEDPDIKKRLKEYLWDSTARAYKQKGVMPKVLATAGLGVKAGVIYAIYNMAKRGLPAFGTGTFSPEQMGERAQDLFTFEGPRKIISNLISGVEGRLGGGAGEGGIEKPEVNFPEELSRLHATKTPEGILSVPVTGERGETINILIQDRNNDGIPEAFSNDGGAHWIKTDTPENAQNLLNILHPKGESAVVDTLKPETPAGGTAAETISGGKPETVTPTTHFENIIKSVELGPGHHDSIWYSTCQMVKEHAKDLGYKGDPNNTQEFNHWAEVRTNHLVNDLTTRMGGKITDLVHDQDVVTIDKITENDWQIKIEARSGIEPGYLPPKLENLPEAEKIDLEKLRVEGGAPETVFLEPQLSAGYEDKVHDLINQRQYELGRLEAAHREFSDQMSDGEYERVKTEINERYNTEIGLYKKLEETAAAKGAATIVAPGIEHQTPPPVEHLEPTVVSQDYQKAQEFLTKIDSAHQGDYQLILGTPDAPNLEMIKFLQDHPNFNFHYIEHLDQDLDLIKTKVGTTLNPETFYQLEQKGYIIEPMKQTEGIFDIEKTIVFRNSDYPPIFIDEHGNYGSRFEDELVKIGTIEKHKINATFLDDLTERIVKHLRRLKAT